MSEVNRDPRSLRQKLAEAELYLRLDDIRDRRIELEDVVAQPDLWDDTERARKVSQELAEITEDIILHEEISSQLEVDFS